MSLQKGDRYLWHGVHIEVTRVASDGRWANIKCYTGEPGAEDYHEWTKEQPTPEGRFPDDWELASDGPEPATGPISGVSGTVAPPGA